LNISILGSGFGIYGYLPAACSLGWKVTTLTRYKEKICKRDELSPYLPSITFVDSEFELLDSEFPIVFARTPGMQFEFLANTFESKVIPSHLFLEKPLTNSIFNSELILDLLRKTQASFSVAYLFQYTKWFSDLLHVTATPGHEILINWCIPFTHSSWKHKREAGGGLFYFFLVHFVPVLTRLGYRISDLEIMYTNGRCTLKGVGRSSIEINAEVVSDDYCFELFVDKSQEPLFRSQTPFGVKPQDGYPDPRVESLKSYLESSLDGSFLLDSAIATELEVITFLKQCPKVTAE
jgi:hypothetical protein